MSLQCSKCHSEKLIPHAKVLDTGQGAIGHLQVLVGCSNPQALIFKGRIMAKLWATICGECGHTELAVENPAALYAQYLANAPNRGPQA